MVEVVRKYRSMCEELRRAIRAGEHAPGERLPAERELAARFGVSHMTARRAVNELVEDSLLERRPPQGTFVRMHVSRRPRAKSINVICPAGDFPLAQQFVQSSLRRIEMLGSTPRLLRFSDADDFGARRALRGRDPSIVLLEMSLNEVHPPIMQTLIEAKEHAVLLGNRLDESGVLSVMSDDADATRQAIDHLHLHGHRRIALLCSNPENFIDRQRIVAWKEQLMVEFDESRIDSWLICARYSRSSDWGRKVYDAVRLFLADEGREVTAIVTSGILAVMAVLSACRDSDRRVPDQMSLVNSVDNPFLEFTEPPVTCVDNLLDEQIDLALTLLDRRCAGTLNENRLFYAIEPRLVTRSSVNRLDPSCGERVS